VIGLSLSVDERASVVGVCLFGLEMLLQASGSGVSCSWRR